MCQQCFEGEKVDWENLRSPEQQNMMESLYYQLMKGGAQGATPFPGQMSAPMTDMQKMAAKTMSRQGGFGWEQQSPKFKPVPNRYNPSNINDLPVRGNVTPPGPTPVPPVPPGPDPVPPPPPPLPPGPGPGPKPGPDPRPGPGPRPDPGPGKEAILQALMMMGMGGSPYDPRNRMG